MYSCFCRKVQLFLEKSSIVGENIHKFINFRPVSQYFPHFVHLVLVPLILPKTEYETISAPIFPFFTPETTYFSCKTPMLIDYSLLIVNNRSQHGIIEFLCTRSLTKDREHNGK